MRMTDEKIATAEYRIDTEDLRLLSRFYYGSGMRSCEEVKMVVCSRC